MKPLYQERSFRVEGRGLLCLGEPIPGADRFVYFSLESLFTQAHILRHYYKLEKCDVLGEGQIEHPFLVPLFKHCKKIGLEPTLVASELPVPACHQLEAAGLDHWLISLHGGSSASHDTIGDAGSFDRLQRAVSLVQRPVRYQTLLCEENYRDLPWKVLVDRPPTVWTLFVRNEFYDLMFRLKAGSMHPSFKEMSPYVAEAVQQVERHGWEVNIRYWPFCLAEEHGFLENAGGWHQAAYDPWDYRPNVLLRIQLEQIEQDEGGPFEAERARATLILKERRNAVCNQCQYRTICDKPSLAYQEQYGTKELIARPGPVEHDPLVFQRKREPA